MKEVARFLLIATFGPFLFLGMVYETISLHFRAGMAMATELNMWLFKD